MRAESHDIWPENTFFNINNVILNYLGKFLRVGVTHKNWNSKMLIFMAPKII